jgi:hypothetical protein
MQVATQLPSTIAYVVGIVLAIVLWRRQPRASMFALIGTAILLAISFLAPILQALAFRYWFLNGSASGNRLTSQYSTTIGVLGVLWALGRAGGYGLILAAVYTGRKRDEHAAGFPVAGAGRVAAPAASPPGAGYRLQ